jgi:hypothetical protein
VGKCYKGLKEYESILCKKTPPQERQTVWIYGKSGYGKSILAKYLAYQKLREEHLEDSEPNYYTDNTNHWFAGFNPFVPLTIIDNLQVKNEVDLQFILGIAGTDPFMFGEKFNSKWFNSQLVIITSISSLYAVWKSLTKTVQERHQFWELGRITHLQIRAEQPEETKEYIFFHYTKITNSKLGKERLNKELLQYRICFNKVTKEILPYNLENNKDHLPKNLLIVNENEDEEEDFYNYDDLNSNANLSNI